MYRPSVKTPVITSCFQLPKSQLLTQQHQKQLGGEAEASNYSSVNTRADSIDSQFNVIEWTRLLQECKTEEDP